MTDPAAARAAAIARHFGGDESLFVDYLADCRRQFPVDLAAGEAACRDDDLPTLRRLAHTLAGVLLALGDDVGHRTARGVEAAAAAGARGAARAAWPALAARLRAVVDAP